MQFPLVTYFVPTLIHVTKLMPFALQCCTEDVYDKVVVEFIYFASTVY